VRTGRPTRRARRWLGARSSLRHFIPRGERSCDRAEPGGPGQRPDHRVIQASCRPDLGGVARGRGSRGADFDGGSGSRGAAQRPQATLSTLQLIQLVLDDDEWALVSLVQVPKCSLVLDRGVEDVPAVRVSDVLLLRMRHHTHYRDKAVP
jgi:hypothetical protein